MSNMSLKNIRLLVITFYQITGRHACGLGGDKAHALNIYRGILSDAEVG